MLEKIIQEGGPNAEVAGRLHGEAAIASAKEARRIYNEIVGRERWKKLAEAGARTQRLLWASTSTKNPAYSDVKYVEPIIGPETINTLPVETLNAYRDHGKPSLTLEQDLDKAQDVLRLLPTLGIHLADVTQQLEDEGVDKFARAYQAALKSLEEKAGSALDRPIDTQSVSAPDNAADISRRVGTLAKGDFNLRMWRKDPTLWDPEGAHSAQILDSLGWLYLPEKMEDNLGPLRSFADAMRAEGFKHVVHMGMGGSSLAPIVFQRTFAPGENGLPLTVLDTTDPATISRLSRQVPVDDSLFIVASKSGTTAEPNAFGEYFYHRLRESQGDKAAAHMAAITDPGSPLEAQARERGYRNACLNYPDIGGRYSALSYFGMMPACLMGLNVEELIARALRMLHACAPSVPEPQNPGLVLGAALGELALHGRDKMTLIVPPALASFGMWLEQLLAESTGKEGKGILPVAGEPVGEPDSYGDDRVFVQLHLRGQEDKRRQQKIDALRRAGHPLITIELGDALDLGQEFFRWEVATAIAGSILGINPFDQPNVGESKENTNRLLEVVRRRAACRRKSPPLSRDRSPSTQSPRRSSSRRGGHMPCGPQRHRGTRCGPSWTRRAPVTMWPSWRTSPRIRRPTGTCAGSAWRCATGSKSLRHPDTGPGTCTPPGNTTRADPTPGSSCFSPPTTLRTSRFRANHTLLGRSGAPRLSGTWRRSASTSAG
jgi:transaldolase/glucose-6-phosphate isomerase